MSRPPLSLCAWTNRARVLLPTRFTAQAVARQQPARLQFRAFSADTFLPVDDVTRRVFDVLKDFPKVNPDKIKLQAHFMNDLGLDSLDTVELVMAFEEEFVLQIPDDMAEKLLTCEDAVKFISQHPMAK